MYQFKRCGDYRTNENISAKQKYEIKMENEKAIIEEWSKIVDNSKYLADSKI